jgi:Fibronectin type III domain
VIRRGTAPESVEDTGHAAYYWQFFAAVVCAYCSIFGYFLLVSDLTPFVMDANESYSSLVHAENMYRFGVRDIVGLTDEAYGPNPEAHPFVYTHQGNFPRFFALLIFALGATSIESQTVVTTATIGLLSVIFAYHFLTRIGSPLFAFICCAIMMTDYVMIAQWHVVTYRVWHMFFFFSALLCIHYIGGTRRALWMSLCYITFVGLFYFEFIFAAFVGVATALYAACIYAGDLRRLLSVWLVQIAGALTSIAVLVSQVIAYLGYDVFLQDLSLTFTSRNQAPAGAAFSIFLKQLQDFYDAHNIVFWFNVVDNVGARAPASLLRNFFQFNLQIYSPLFAAIALILFAGWAFSRLADIPARPVALRDRFGEFLTGHVVLGFALAGVLTVLLPFSLPYQSPPALQVWRQYSMHYLAFLAGYVLLLSWLLYAVGSWAATNRTLAHLWQEKRFVRLLAVIGLTGLLAGMPTALSHRSEYPVFLDRYSLAYTAILAVIAFLALAGLAAFSKPAWLGRHVGRLLPVRVRATIATGAPVGALTIASTLLLTRGQSLAEALTLPLIAIACSGGAAAVSDANLRNGATMCLRAVGEALQKPGIRVGTALALALLVLAGPPLMSAHAGFATGGRGATLTTVLLSGYFILLAAMASALAYSLAGLRTPGRIVLPEALGSGALLMSLFIGHAVFIATVLLTPLPLGMPGWSVDKNGMDWLLTAFFAALLAVPATVAAKRFAFAVTEPADRSPRRRLWLAACLLLAMGVFIRSQGELYDAGFIPVWNAITPLSFPNWLLRLVLLITGYIAVRLVLSSPNSGSLIRERDVSTRAWWLVAAGFVGFAVVYTLSPGYVRTAYLLRYTPFAVFLVSVIFGIATIVLVRALMQGLRGMRLLLPGSATLKGENPTTRLTLPWSSPGRLAVVVVVLLVFAGIWQKAQKVYMAYLPPDRFEFLKSLRQPRFAGKSFVVNTYAAPVTTFTGNWAYYDPILGSADFEFQEGGPTIRRDSNTYLWLADKRSNSDYQRPDYFLCMIPADFSFVLFQISGRPFPKCSNVGLVQRARDSEETRVAKRVVDEDRSVRGAWAIVELDWSDDAPYLAPLAEGSRSFVGLEATSRKGITRIGVDYRFRSKYGDSEGDTVVSLNRLGDDISCPTANAQASILSQAPRRKHFVLPAGFEGALSATAGSRYSSRTFLVHGDKVTDCHRQPMDVVISRPRPDSISLSWKPPYDVLQYEIYLRELHETEYRPIGNIPGNLDAYRIDTIAPGADYSVRVRPCSPYGCMPDTEVISTRVIRRSAAGQ